MNNENILTVEPVSWTSSISFSCQKGYVNINLSTGEVTYDDCDPPESGKAFWLGVAAAYPHVKEEIQNS